AVSGQELLALEGTPNIVTSMSFSPDGRRLVSSDMNMIKMWDAPSGQELLILRGHTDFVESIGISPDSQRIIARDRKGMVKAWSARPGAPLEPVTDPAPQGTDRQVHSPDRKLLAWANGDEVLVRRLDDVARQERKEQLLTLEWHRHTAAAAERGSQWFAAAFHLTRLVAAEPDDPAHRLRRGLASAHLGRWNEAFADLGKACQLLSRKR